MNQFVNPTKMVMSQCKTCRHSEGKAVSGGWVLYCNKHDRITYQACESYEREPGSDDE
jgi:hypothetical protein